MTLFHRNTRASMNRFHYRLSTLLFLVFVLAVAIQWVVLPTYAWVTVPTYKINSLAHDVNNGASDAAVKPLVKGEAWQRSLVRHLANGRKVKTVTSNTRVSIAPLSISDILSGERRLTVTQGHNVETVDGCANSGYSIAKGKMTMSGVQ